MLIVCHVCAEFHDRKGETLFAVQPEMINCLITAPKEIIQDPLFDMLAAEGSLEAVTTLSRKKALENNPTAGINAEGRIPTVSGPEEAIPEDELIDDLKETEAKGAPKSKKATTTGKAAGSKETDPSTTAASPTGSNPASDR